MQLKWLGAIAGVCLASPASAAAINDTFLKDMRVIETIGTWQLRKRVDPFTDAASCVMINSGNGHYQATNHDLFIQNERSGRVYSYRLRFDDNPPSFEKAAKKNEVMNNYVDIEWFDFGALLSASRLRVEITTKPSFSSKMPMSVYSVDIDVRGFSAIRESWRKNGCPG